jgi:hypothetical protein
LTNWRLTSFLDHGQRRRTVARQPSPADGANEDEAGDVFRLVDLDVVTGAGQQLGAGEQPMERSGDRRVEIWVGCPEDDAYWPGEGPEPASLPAAAEQDTKQVGVEAQKAGRAAGKSSYSAGMTSRLTASSRTNRPTCQAYSRWSSRSNLRITRWARFRMIGVEYRMIATGGRSRGVHP